MFPFALLLSFLAFSGLAFPLSTVVITILSFCHLHTNLTPLRPSSFGIIPGRTGPRSRRRPPSLYLLSAPLFPLLMTHIPTSNLFSLPLLLLLSRGLIPPLLSRPLGGTMPVLKPILLRSTCIGFTSAPAHRFPLLRLRRPTLLAAARSAALVGPIFVLLRAHSPPPLLHAVFMI